MSKIIREVGFLALGVAALLEVCIYGRVWTWHDDLIQSQASLAALFVLLLGVYFAQDGTAWSELANLLKRIITSPSTPVEVRHYCEHRATSGSVAWTLDFAALLLAVISLGLGIQLLASYENDHAHVDDRTTLLVLSGVAITAMFALTALFWFVLDWEQAEGRRGVDVYLGQAGKVWWFGERPYIIKWVLCMPIVVSGALTTMAYLIGINTLILQASVGALFLLNLTYLVLRRRLPRYTSSSASIDVSVLDGNLPALTNMGYWEWKKVYPITIRVAVGGLIFFLFGLLLLIVQDLIPDWIGGNWISDKYIALRIIAVSLLAICGVGLFHLVNRVFGVRNNLADLAAQAVASATKAAASEREATQSAEKATQSAEKATQSAEKATQSAEKATQSAETAAQSAANAAVSAPDPAEPTAPATRPATPGSSAPDPAGPPGKS